MAIAPEKRKIFPVVIIILAVLIVVGFGYYVFNALTDNDDLEVTEGQPLDTSVLDSSDLQLTQYEPAQAPSVEASQLGRDDPFAPY